MVLFRYGGTFAGHHTNRPRTLILILYGHNLLACKALVSRTEGTWLDGLKIPVGFLEDQILLRTLGLCGHNHNPPSGNGLSPQFRYGYINPG